MPRFLGRNTLKIFRLPRKLTITEYIVEAALLFPFVLWFAEALVGLMWGSAFVRTYWLPVAYVLPVHIGVVISLALLLPIGAAALFRWYVVKRKIDFKAKK